MKRSYILKQFIQNYLTIEHRPIPSVIIIGAQKAGTTSLFCNLENHPNILSSFIKEPQYFNRRYSWGLRAYRSFFPKVDPSLRGPIHVLESSPDYLFLPEVPARIQSLIPQTKLIIMLREPVSRAYSQFQHNSRRGWENRSFEEAVEEDLAKLRQNGVLQAPEENWRKYRDHSYVRRGVYHPQLNRWLELFPRDNIHLMTAEAFYDEPELKTSETLRFLGLDTIAMDTSDAKNAGNYNKKSIPMRERLSEVFAPYNRQLSEDYGINWSAPTP